MACDLRQGVAMVRIRLSHGVLFALLLVVPVACSSAPSGAQSSGGLSGASEAGLEGSSVATAAACNTGPGVTSVVANGQYAYSIAVDDGQIYFGSTNGVWRVADTGGTPSLLNGSSEVNAIAIDSAHVYWIGISLMSAPLGGGDPTIVAAGVFATELLVDGLNVYGVDGTLWAVSVSGGAKRSIIDGPSAGVEAIALFGDSVYVASFSGIAAGTGVAYQGSILRVPKAGGAAPVVLVSNQPHPYAIAVDSTGVYWANAGYLGVAGGLMHSALDGNNATTLPSSINVGSVVLDETNVYWTEDSGRVMKMAKSGGDPQVIADGLSGPSDLLVNGGNVYWSEQPGLDASLIASVISVDGGQTGAPPAATVMTACK
jgi:hypothetical protein